MQRIDILVNVVDKASAQLNRVQNRLQQFGRSFKMEYLSLLFFGMAIQRMFLGLARTGMDAYMKITEGQTEFGQSTLKLAAAWEYTKFVIGEAIGSVLTALLPTILPIIRKITDWVEQNKELVGWIIIIGVILGTLMMTFGIVALGIRGMLAWIGNMIGAFKMLGVAATFLMANPVILAIALIAAAIIFLYFAWQNNWFNIRQTTGVIVHGIANAFFYLVEAGQFLLTGMIIVWNGILTVVEMVAGPIIDVINGIGAAYAWLTGDVFDPIQKDFLTGFKMAGKDLIALNKQIDEFQQKTGQGIFDFGTDLITQGNLMNQGINPSVTNVGDITTNITVNAEGGEVDYDELSNKVNDIWQEKIDAYGNMRRT